MVNELIDGDDSALARLADKLAPLLVDRLVAPATGEGWLRGADEIAAYIGSPRSRVYALASARRIPVQRDGSALVARPIGARLVAAKWRRKAAVTRAGEAGGAAWCTGRAGRQTTRTVRSTLLRARAVPAL